MIIDGYSKYAEVISTIFRKWLTSYAFFIVR